jgi:uncharacterized protein
LPITRGDRILLDTGFFIAVHNSADPHRETALELLDAMKELGLRMVTSDYVLDEAVTTAYRRTGRRDVAIDVANMILASKHVKILYSSEALVGSAWAAYQKYNDQELSFTDCHLLAICAQQRIGYLVSFDGDFRGVVDGPVILASRSDLDAQR